MTKETLASEKDRFNALTQDEAKLIAEYCEGASGGIRSCWHCNGAHEHLKDTDYFTCFACGISYVRGFPAPILGMRMRGEEITDEVMHKFNSILGQAE